LASLVREEGDLLVVGTGSWYRSSHLDLLLHFEADGLMRIHERLVQLLALEVQVTGRGYHAQDHEGIAHESIRSASIEEVRELHEAQEVEGLCGGLMIEEVPDRRERTGMSHLQPGHGRDFVMWSILQRSVELPNVPGLVRRGEHTLVHECQQDVALLVVPVLVRGLA
jgi:hypothetical protein